MKNKRAGFLLLETMIGVAIFAIGVIVLARSMNHCLDAEFIRSRDQLARLALENALAKIEGGSLLVGDTPGETPLEGRYTGITLHVSRQPLEFVNEDDVALEGLYLVTLEAVWREPHGTQRKAITLYRYDPAT